MGMRMLMRKTLMRKTLMRSIVEVAIEDVGVEVEDVMRMLMRKTLMRKTLMRSIVVEDAIDVGVDVVDSSMSLKSKNSSSSWISRTSRSTSITDSHAHRLRNSRRNARLLVKHTMWPSQLDAHPRRAIACQRQRWLHTNAV